MPIIVISSSTEIEKKIDNYIGEINCDKFKFLTAMTIKLLFFCKYSEGNYGSCCNLDTCNESVFEQWDVGEMKAH